MTSSGIIIFGGLAFVLLAAACVVQQAGDVARPAATNIALGEPLRGATAALAPATAPPAATTDPLPAPMLRAEFSAGAPLVLTGRVPDAGVRDAIVERAMRLYGRAQVQDRLTITEVSRPAWLGAAFPPDLRDTRFATALLQDGRLLVIGDTGSDSARARVEAGMLPFAAQNLTLDVRLNAGVVEIAPAGAPVGPTKAATGAGSSTLAAGNR